MVKTYHVHLRNGYVHAFASNKTVTFQEGFFIVQEPDGTLVCMFATDTISHVLEHWNDWPEGEDDEFDNDPATPEPDQPEDSNVA